MLSPGTVLTQCSRSERAADADCLGPRQRMGRSPHHRPLHGMGMPLEWLFLVFGSFIWTGRGPRAGVPVASRGFVMQKPFCCEVEVGGGTTRGLKEPRGFARPEKVGAARPDLPAQHAQLSLVRQRNAVPQFTHLHLRQGQDNLSIFRLECLFLKEYVRTWALSGVWGAAETPHLEAQAPWQNSSTQELASGIFLTKSRSNFPWHGAFPARGAWRGACQGIARVSLQKAAAPEQN